MGHYTELKCKIQLRTDTPNDLINTLKRVIIDHDLGVPNVFSSEDVFKPEFNHEFFKCRRWYMLFLSKNCSDIKGGMMYQRKDYWIIDLHTEFKNYDKEINKFINFISPFVIGRKKKEYIGWYKSENMNQRINIYVER